MTTKTDTYNYTQNPLSGNYTTVCHGGLQSTTTGAVGTNAGVDCVTMWATSNNTFLADQTSEVTVGTPGNFDWVAACVRLNTAASGTGYVLYYKPDAPIAALYTLNAGAITQASPLATFTTGTLVSTDKIKLGVVGTTFTCYVNGVSAGTFTDATYASGQPGFASNIGNTGATRILAWTGTDAAAGAPTLSAPTPSGTLGTSTTATLGCTTDTNSGTLYGVVDTAANISGVTAAQVVAGNNKNGSAAAKSANNTVSTTTPSVAITALTASTLYSYALAQNNGSNSNVVTGTFTTAAPPTDTLMGQICL